VGDAPNGSPGVTGIVCIAKSGLGVATAASIGGGIVATRGKGTAGCGGRVEAGTPTSDGVMTAMAIAVRNTVAGTRCMRK
jgi:hypothetical protein